MKVAICIDYDNLERIHKSEGILGVVTTTLQKLSGKMNSPALQCEVRLYGGWFEGESMSKLSQDLSVGLQSDFPAVIRLPIAGGEICKIIITAELAFSLLEEPGYHLLNTYRKKGKPRNVRVTTPDDAGCISESCLLPLARKLLKNGSCPAIGCIAQNTPLVYRHEQKLVDTMLTCDLIYLSGQQYNFLVLVSADDDFLPPLRTLLLRGSNIIRIHPKLSSISRPINAAGNNLMEIGL